MRLGIGRDDVPRRMIRIGSRNGTRIDLLVTAPAFPFGEVLRIEFPMLVRIIDTFLQTLALRIFGNVQKELDDDAAGLAKQAFKILDLRITAQAFSFVNPIVHTRNQHVFIMATIENSQFTLPGNLLMDTP